MNNNQTLTDAAELLKTFGDQMVPMIGFCQPKLLELDNEKCTIVLPLSTHTKNHLGSMYFGALHVGADCAAGMMAMRSINEAGANISLVFKDSQAQFFKRPDGDVHFTCLDGADSAAIVRQALENGERQECSMKVVATVPAKYKGEVVAEFSLTLSLKRQ